MVKYINETCLFTPQLSLRGLIAFIFIFVDFFLFFFFMHLNVNVHRPQVLPTAFFLFVFFSLKLTFYFSSVLFVGFMNKQVNCSVALYRPCPKFTSMLDIVHASFIRLPVERFSFRYFLSFHSTVFEICDLLKLNQRFFYFLL